MLQEVATRHRETRSGAYVRALRQEMGKSLMEFGAELGKDKATIYRWEDGLIDELTWLGVLTRLGKRPDWEPTPAQLAAAETEIRERANARAAAKTPPPPTTPRRGSGRRASTSKARSH